MMNHSRNEMQKLFDQLSESNKSKFIWLVKQAASIEHFFQAAPRKMLGFQNNIPKKGRIKMDNNRKRYSFQISQVLFQKLAFISRYEMRTVNKQIIQLVKCCIQDFEKEHGEIQADDRSSSQGSP